MTQAANLGALGTNVNSSGIAQAAGGGTAGTAGVTGFKNRIINGDMSIDQRNNGASVTPTTSNNVFSVDRWLCNASQSTKYTVQQNAGSVTPPVGFTNYMGVTSSSAYSITSSDYFFLEQDIEGLNCGDLAWGTANARTVTLSFWVRSSLTGTFGASLRNSSGGRSYPFAYTINSANTWEQKSVTIAGDTSGTWLTTNGIGIRLSFSIGSGSNWAGIAGAWNSDNDWTVSGAVSVVGTNGATFYITGVQLEVGTAATNFDYLPYTTELQLCQRYCFVPVPPNFYIGLANGTNSGLPVIPWPVTMRTAPTAVFTGNFVADNGVSNVTFTAANVSLNQSSVNTGRVYLNNGTPSAWSGAQAININGASALGMIFSAEL